MQTVGGSLDAATEYLLNNPAPPPAQPASLGTQVRKKLKQFTLHPSYEGGGGRKLSGRKWGKKVKKEWDKGKRLRA